jgi:glycosyltransferase involved in cell wall biosynthesis
LQKKLIRITTVPISLRYLLQGQMAYMSHRFKVYAISSPGPELDEVASQEKVETIGVKMTRKITPITDLIALFKLFTIFRKLKPDIVHTHTPKAGLLGMMAARMAGVPVRLHTVAGLPLMERKGLEKSVLVLAEKLTYFLANKVYPNSKGLLDYIVQNNFSKKSKLKIIGNGSSNGINLELFQLQENEYKSSKNVLKKLEIGNNDIIFTFIGRLVRDKGIEELVTAFNRVSLKYSKICLFFVGPKEDDLDPVSAEILETIRLNDRIIPVGFQSDVRPYLAISTVFVLPSYREGFPNVVLQAGCFNLPCIVSNINGCNEIIEDGVNGLLVEPKSVSSLEKAMIRMIENEDERKRMASIARGLIIDRYDQKVIWRLWLAEYNYWLKSKRV